MADAEAKGLGLYSAQVQYGNETDGWKFSGDRVMVISNCARDALASFQEHLDSEYNSRDGIYFEDGTIFRVDEASIGYYADFNEVITKDSLPA